MASDYKHVPRPPAQRASGGHSGPGTARSPAWLVWLGGFLSGLLAAAVVIYVRHSEPGGPPPRGGLAETARQTGQSHPASGHKPGVPALPLKMPAQPTYDFYKLLPDMEVKIPPEQERLQVKPKATVPPKNAEPSVSPHREAQSEPRRAASGPHYLLQAGTFSRPGPADQLKAKLAMLGLESSIQRIDAGKHEELYRVHVGPFRDLAQAQRVQSQLKRQSIDAIMLRAGAGP
jgi:cell division protein FtsN